MFLFFFSCDRVDPYPPAEPASETPSFVIHGPDSVEIGSANSTFIFVESHVENLSNDSLNITWVILESSHPEGWERNVCDPNNCYPPHVVSKDFDIGTGEEELLDAGFRAHGILGDGHTKLLIYQTNDSLNTALVVDYYAEAE